MQKSRKNTTFSSSFLRSFLSNINFIRGGIKMAKRPVPEPTTDEE
jgi:hypothetical protein